MGFGVELSAGQIGVGFGFGRGQGCCDPVAGAEDEDALSRLGQRLQQSGEDCDSFGGCAFGGGGGGGGFPWWLRVCVHGGLLLLVHYGRAWRVFRRGLGADGVCCDLTSGEHGCRRGVVGLVEGWLLGCIRCCSVRGISIECANLAGCFEDTESCVLWWHLKGEHLGFGYLYRLFAATKRRLIG